LVNIITNFSQKASKIWKEFKKILFSDGNIRYSFLASFEDRTIGGIREDWFVNFIKNIWLNIRWSSKQDFIVKWNDGRFVKFEIGWKNKKIKPRYEVDEDFYLVLDDIRFASEKRIPLWWFWLLKAD
jgi:hypothetical protein